MSRSCGWTRVVVAVAAVVAVVITGCTAKDDADDRARSGESDEVAPLSIEIVSSRPEYISGGDALVALTLGPGVDPLDVTVKAAGEDLAQSVIADADDPNRLMIHIAGLPEGESMLVAHADGQSAELAVTNYPPNGPMFSGEHLELVACTTEVFGLAPATLEDDCVAPTEISWRYVDTAGEMKDLADPSAPPPDAEMVEVDGERVPFIVRDETGVLNRSVYRISLFEPRPYPSAPIKGVDTSAWNERLVYRFGGGCGATFSQGFDWTGKPSLEVLRRGYAVATATFNTFQVLCNDVISAETASMVKEHFVEAYGEPVHTIGDGGSGGAIQQILLAQNYPGLLDAIAPSLPFPDALSIGPGVFDCALLTDYYATPTGAQLSEAQLVAINGHALSATCTLWDSSFANNIDPAGGCRFNVADAFGSGGLTPVPTIPEADIYDPATNPSGRRCTVWESNVAVTGRDPATGFARSGYDNEGVQYGLTALNAGVITFDQFLDLNEKIGGFDFDGRPQAERSVVDEELVARAYETGRVSGPWGGLPDTPIILTNLYTDELGDIHDRVRAFALLDRLSDDDGNWPATASLWTTSVQEGASMIDTLSGTLGELAAQPTFALDEWLTAASEHQDDEGGSWRDALAATKPEAAESRCLVDGQDPIVGPDANDDPECTAAFPLHEEPRMVAGAPRSGDLLKCQLVSLYAVASDLYEVELTEAQIDRLVTVFPDGVCDYSRPSVGQAPLAGTWLSFSPN